jgi:cytochrome c oxidase subunit 4
MSDIAHAEDVRKQVRVYIAVFAALAVLTVVTVAVAYLNLPIGLALVVALIIATIKGGLVASYFMHLISEKKVIYSIVVLTVGLLVAMFFLITSTGYDQDGGYVVP